MDIERTRRALEANRFEVSVFSTAGEAADYLDSEIDGKRVGFGDSITIKEMDLFRRLSVHNEVHDPNQYSDNDEFLEAAMKCLDTEVYLTSVNAMSETGQMVNIDGTGNRVAASLFGHKKVYFVVSRNKIEESLEKAVWRARNVAGPRNAMKYGLATPCVRGEHVCHDCSSPQRICNTMNIYMKKMNDVDHVEVVLIDEDMGY